MRVIGCFTSSPTNASTAAPASRYARSRPSTPNIYTEEDVPDEWSDYTQFNADFFAELGSPGGAARVGLTENDPAAVKNLESKA